MEHAVESTKQTEPKADSPARARNVASTTQPLHPMLQLQQQAGNQAMQELLRTRAIQAKMAISHPDDPEEREADHVADRVMRSHAGFPIAASCSCGASGDTCEECQQKQSQPKISRRASAPSAPAHVPRIIGDVLRSPGQPLDSSTRSFMEPRFGRDFSGVRVHTDARAAESAAAVQARAYTVGHNIVFGGKESASDLPVLAHELTHVVQQTGTAPVVQRLSFCRDFLEVFTPYVAEDNVRDSLAGDAALFGKVETELYIPEGTAAAQRTEEEPTAIYPYIGGYPGYADVALLTGSTLEILEVKKATWDPRGATFAEGQLEKYLRKGTENIDYVTENWRTRRRGNRTDEIQSVKAMPMTRLSLQPNPRVIDGEPVSLRWCDDGIVVFKRQPPEEKEKKEKEKKKEPESPADTLPEKLLKMGEDLAVGLAADALLGVALELSGALAAVVLSPLAAVAALVLGIVYFWDKLKSLGRRIAALANWVWGKITWILDTIKSLAIDIGELAVWLGEKVVWLAKTLAAGAKWAAGKAVAGAKWVGHEVASGAEAVWDWLFGSDPEPVAPTLDLPEIENTMHCGTVAHEDTIVKIPADLLFATNESKLIPAADSPLTEAAGNIRSMLGHSDDRVMIEGYTDNVGGVDYNQGLSERRAQAVADWFVQHRAIPMSVIRIEGFGKTKAQNNDPEGRAKDRHVEIWVTKHGSTEKVCW
jgi:outer membrane protein OmpA-like peptidoglycan-associated protein